MSTVLRQESIDFREGFVVFVQVALGSRSKVRHAALEAQHLMRELGLQILILDVLLEIRLQR